MAADCWTGGTSWLEEVPDSLPSELVLVWLAPAQDIELGWVGSLSQSCAAGISKSMGLRARKPSWSSKGKWFQRGCLAVWYKTSVVDAACEVTPWLRVGSKRTGRSLIGTRTSSFLSGLKCSNQMVCAENASAMD
eukprot:1731846-Amphidinium_carterae.2